jgi:hypothetical protein
MPRPLHPLNLVYAPGRGMNQAALLVRAPDSRALTRDQYLYRLGERLQTLIDQEPNALALIAQATGHQIDRLEGAGMTLAELMGDRLNLIGLDLPPSSKPTPIKAESNPELVTAALELTLTEWLGLAAPSGPM